MARVDRELRQAWRDEPETRVEVIVHVDDAQARTASLRRQGLRVRRAFALTQTVAGSCKAAAAQAMADLDWVKRIELDRPVRATRR